MIIIIARVVLATVVVAAVVTVPSLVQQTSRSAFVVEEFRCLAVPLPGTWIAPEGVVFFIRYGSTDGNNQRDQQCHGQRESDYVLCAGKHIELSEVS